MTVQQEGLTIGISNEGRTSKMILKARIEAIESEINRDDYFAALEERDEYDLFTEEWNEACNDVNWVMYKAIENGDSRVAAELCDCLLVAVENESYGEEFNDGLAILKKYGYDDYVREITDEMEDYDE